MVGTTLVRSRSGAGLIRQRALRSAPCRAVRVNALFDFFKQTSVKNVTKKDQLIDDLLRLTEDADAGFAVSSQGREAIAEVVDDLQSYCMKDPLSSEYIFGRWEVRYASKPQTAGGPFKTPIGRIVFPGQTAIQVIAEPNVCINEISFKTLGFVPGSVTQEGTIDPLDGRTFEITFTTNTGKKLGGPPKRLIEILYLDENIRIARAVPTEENQEPGFYIFTREGVEFELDEVPETVVAAAPARGPAKAAKIQEEGPSKAEMAKLERERMSELRAMAKEQYAQLNAEAKDLALESQASSKQLLTLDREAAKVIKDASTARKTIEKIKGIVDSVEANLAESQSQEVFLEKELLALQREANKIKQQLVSTKKSLGPKIK